MRIHILLMFCVCVLCANQVCASDPGITAREVRLGMVNAQSGAASGLGKGMRTGAEAVFQDINSRGGVHGRKINLLVADDGYDPDRAIDATLKMIEEQKVFALFGYVGTPTANAVLPIIKETNTPLIGPFTGAMTLRKPVIPNVINIRASYDDEPEMLVEYFIKNKGAKRFAVFYQNDGFGLAVLSGTINALKRRGMEVIAKGTFQRGTTAIKTGLATIMESVPDVVIMVGPYTPLSTFIKAAKTEMLNANLATVSFVGTNDLVNLVGRDGDGIVISQVVPFPADRSLPITIECTALLEKYAPGETLGFVSFEGCITAKTMIIALEKAGPTLTRTNLIHAFETINNLDIGGIRLNLGQENHQASNAVFLTKIVDGEITQIKMTDR